MTIQVEILQFLHYNPSSSRVEIAAGLSETPNERTLKRIIAERVNKGDIIVEGKGKATRYSLSAQAHLTMPLDMDTYFANDVDDRTVQESFNFQLIRDVLPNVALFTEEERARLETAQKTFLGNMSSLSEVEYRKEMERLGVDSVDYKKAMLMFYEQNNIVAFKRIFIEQYEFAVKNYF